MRCAGADTIPQLMPPMRKAGVRSPQLMHPTTPPRRNHNFVSARHAPTLANTTTPDHTLSHALAQHTSRPPHRGAPQRLGARHHRAHTPRHRPTMTPTAAANTAGHHQLHAPHNTAHNFCNSRGSDHTAAHARRHTGARTHTRTRPTAARTRARTHTHPHACVWCERSRLRRCVRAHTHV